MKKIYVQVIDNFTGIYQTGMIQEPVSKGKEIENALAHFGVSYGTVNWTSKEEKFMYGEVEGTTKIVIVYIL